MEQPKKVGKVSFVLEEDIAKHPKYLACLPGCTGGEEGFIMCSHCSFWFHLQCFGLEDAPARGQWYCSGACKKGGYRICVPQGNPSDDWDNDQLKAYCKHFGMQTSGTKEVLIQRLNSRLKSGLECWGSKLMKEQNVQFVARQGPSIHHDLDKDESQPWLDLMWGSDVWDMLVRATNQYAESRKGKWTEGLETTEEELKAFIGVRIRMGVLGVTQVRDLWSTELLGEEHVAKSYSEIFSRERFEDLTRNLHVVDNSNPPHGPTRDRFWKLRPLIESLQKEFKSHWDPHQHLSLDEEGIKTKARIEMKQYNKEKPAKWFIKVFALVDSCNYLWAFNIYSGKVAEEEEKKETSRSTRNSLGVADSIVDIPDVSTIYKHVMRLARQLPENRPFHLYLNNWYTNLRVMEDLRKRNVFCTGTFKSKSGGFPDSIKLAKLENRGEWKWETLVGKEFSFGCLKWKDTKDVLLASSYWPPHQASQVRNCFFFFFFDVGG